MTPIRPVIRRAEDPKSPAAGQDADGEETREQRPREIQRMQDEVVRETADILKAMAKLEGLSELAKEPAELSKPWRRQKRRQTPWIAAIPATLPLRPIGRLNSSGKSPPTSKG